MAILESSDFGGTYPTYGFTSNYNTDENTYFTWTRFLGSGPGSRDYVRTTNLVTAVGTQFYSGWASSITAPATDESRFVRVRLRVGSGFDATGVSDVWSNKWIMLGDQGSAAEGDRVIAVLSPRIGTTDCQLRVGKNIGDFGTTDATEDVNLTLGSWQSIQFEVRAGSSPYIKLWVNNDTYASPTKQVSGAGLSGWSSAGWDSCELGFYQNMTTASGGNVVLDHAQFEVSDTFDSTYHANLNTGGSSGTGTIWGIGLGEF
jgi:hypothetical protein